MELGKIRFELPSHMEWFSWYVAPEILIYSLLGSMQTKPFHLARDFKPDFAEFHLLRKVLEMFFHQ